MNYTELKANIQDTCETTFTADQLAMFTQQAEQKIYNYVQIPALRKTDDGPLVQTNKLYTLPSDFLYTYSIAVISSSTSTYLLNKDVNFDSALLNGALLEAIRFMKGEADIIANYEKMYLLSISLLKNLGDGKLREDVYRSGQFRTPVT